MPVDAPSPRGITPLSDGKCPNCGRWRPMKKDIYCAWCGKPVIVVTTNPIRVRLSPEGQKQGADLTETITLRNDGVNTAYVSVELTKLNQDAPRFSLLPSHSSSDPYDIDPGQQLDIAVRFNTKGINNPQTYFSAELDIAYQAGQFHVPIEVVRPENLVNVLNQPRLQFRDGDPIVFSHAIRNTGGSRAELTRIVFASPSGMEQRLDETLAVNEEKKLYVPIPLGISHDSGEFRGRIETASGQGVDFRRQYEYRAGARIRVLNERPAITLYPMGRRGAIELNIENAGSAELHIVQIKVTGPGHSADKPVIIPVVKNRTIPPSGPTPGKGFIDLHIDGRTLKPGRYEFTIQIESNALDGVAETVLHCVVENLPELLGGCGFDFGTSASCVALANPEPVLVDFNTADENSALTPSLIYFSEEYLPITGEAARTQQSIQHPDAIVNSLKRLFGSGNMVRVRERDLRVEDVAAEIIRHLGSAVERQERKTPGDAVFSHPVEFRDDRLRTLVNAARLAGAHIPQNASDRLLSEPVAAAFYYLYKVQDHEVEDSRQPIFIYDLGAGTLDCSIVLITQSSDKVELQVLGATGDVQLGGDDVDLRFARSLAEKFADAEIQGLLRSPNLGWRKGTLPLNLAQLSVRREYVLAAEQAKIALSTAQQCEVSLRTDLGPNRLTKVVRREEFEATLEQFIERSRAVIRACLEVSGVSSQDVTTLLHTGRGSQIPLILRHVQQELPAAKDQSSVIGHKNCVALGAAYWNYLQKQMNSGVIFRPYEPKLQHEIGYRSFVRLQEILKPVFPVGAALPSRATISIPTRAGEPKELHIYQKRHGHAEPRTGWIARLIGDGNAADIELQLSENATLAAFYQGKQIPLDQPRGGVQ